MPAAVGPSDGLFAEEDAAKKVVKLQKEPANLADAWPGVTWEQVSSARASTTVGAFIKGSIPENISVLLENVGNGRLANRLTDYLVDLAGPANMITTSADLIEWLDSQFSPVIEKIQATFTKQKELAEVFKGTVGSFGMAAAMLKKVYQETEHNDKADSIDDDDDIDPTDHHSDDDDYND